jgi:hypothetical protein
MLLIGATARSYRSLVVQTLAVTLCFVAMKRYVLEVPEHVAPEVLGPFLDGVAAALGDFFTFLIWSSVSAPGRTGRATMSRKGHYPLGFSNSRQRSPFARFQSGHFTLTLWRLNRWRSQRPAVSTGGLRNLSAKLE